MEIKFLNISIKNKNKYLIKNLNLDIKDGLITGIYKDNKTITNLLLNKTNYQGQVLLDNLELNQYDENIISFVSLLDNNTFLTKTVSDEFYLAKRKLKDTEDTYLKKVISSLMMVGLDEFYLQREITTLSKTEKRLLQVAIALISNPDIIIFEEPFLYLSKNARSDISRIIIELKKKYKKTIIILSCDINVLYELSNNLIIFNDNKFLISDTVNSIFKDIDFLEKNKIELPNLILFNKIATIYNQKLTNHKDVKDLIKEVYRNVSEIKKET